MTRAERERIRAATARLATRLTAAEVAERRREKVLRTLKDGPAQTAEVCVEFRDAGKKVIEALLSRMQQSGEVVFGRVRLTESRAAIVAPLNVWALPEHAESLEVVS